MGEGATYAFPLTELIYRWLLNPGDDMDTLDVFELAKQVSEDSLSGSISKELLLKENVLYGNLKR